MARRNRNTESSPTTENDINTEEESTVSTYTETDEPTEAPAYESTEEAAPESESSDEAASESGDEAAVTVEPTESEPVAPKPEADLTEFKARVAEAVEGKDSSTGEVAPGLFEPVSAAYRAIDGVKGKNAAKAFVSDQMRDAMNSTDIQSARAYMNLGDHLTAATPHAGSARVPTDPTEAFIHLIVGLRLAQALAAENVPEGVAEDWSGKADALLTSSEGPAREYLAWTKSEDENKGDEPIVESVVKAAVKLSVGKSAKVGSAARSTSTPFTGTRRDIGKHIAAAFEGIESGTFLTVAQIRKHHSDEYGDELPSAGAVSARLFPRNNGKCTIEGITPGQLDGKGNKGAYKD